MASNRTSERVAFYLSDLASGGVQKTTLTLAHALTERGIDVDLVVCRDAGSLRAQVPHQTRVVPLDERFGWLSRAYPLAADPAGLGVLLRPIVLPLSPPKRLRFLPGLVRYLRRERPRVFISANPDANLQALWARDIAGVPTRVVVTERISPEAAYASRKWRSRYLPPLIRRTYSKADAVVAVSEGVADTLAALTGISRERIETIPNPIVTSDLHLRAATDVEHSWFERGAPPVLLAAGRLHKQKDYPTLIRAFARVRRNHDARLVILGEAKDPEEDQAQRAALTALAVELKVEKDVLLPGFVDNPFSYMARAAVFVLSSAWEGLPAVVVQALACGCPVVSSDCPSGPREILSDGDYGALVQVGDDEALAAAIENVLLSPRDADRLRQRAAMFSVENAVRRYSDLLSGLGLRVNAETHTGAAPYPELSVA